MSKSAELTHDARGPRVDFIEPDGATTTGAVSSGLEPIRRLADATLWAAIQDASGEDERHAYSATRWLLGDAIEGFSLAACCVRLGLAPHSVLSSLMRHYPAIRIRIEEYRRIASVLGPAGPKY